MLFAEGSPECFLCFRKNASCIRFSTLRGRGAPRENMRYSYRQTHERRNDILDARHLWIYRQIGARVAYYRTIEGLSQEAFALKIAISKGTLSKIERGRYNSGLSIATLLSIADGLGVDLAALISENETEKKIYRDRRPSPQ